MENNSKQLAVIPNTGKPVPHITLTYFKKNAPVLSSIVCSNDCSIGIHVTP